MTLFSRIAGLPGWRRVALAATTTAALLAAPGARAFEIESAGLTVVATPTIASDYLFRGISQTRNNWAFQGVLDVQHASGFYIGAFVSNAKFLANNPYNDTRQEIDALAGYRLSLGALNLDLGYIGYFYPGQDKPPGGVQLNEFHEVALKANYTTGIVKLLAAGFYSPNYFGRSGDGFYLEGGADVTLPYEVTASARLGYQWIERNPLFGTPDYLNFSFGVSREIYGGVIASIGVAGTDINKSQCAPVAGGADNGQRICDTRALFTLSRVF